MVVQPFKVLVCGGRLYDDFDALCYHLDKIHEAYGITELIHGNARGADSLADRWADLRGIPVKRFPPDWDKHGISAGPRRNNTMIKQKPDLVVAFPGGPGTADMIKKAHQHSVSVIEVNINDKSTKPLQ